MKIPLYEVSHGGDLFESWGENETVVKVSDVLAWETQKGQTIDEFIDVAAARNASAEYWRGAMDTLRDLRAALANEGEEKS